MDQIANLRGIRRWILVGLNLAEDRLQFKLGFKRSDSATAQRLGLEMAAGVILRVYSQARPARREAATEFVDPSAEIFRGSKMAALTECFGCSGHSQVYLLRGCAGFAALKKEAAQS